MKQHREDRKEHNNLGFDFNFYCLPWCQSEEKGNAQSMMEGLNGSPIL